jgi:hypothetical protein
MIDISFLPQFLLSLSLFLFLSLLPQKDWPGKKLSNKNENGKRKKQKGKLAIKTNG